MKNLLKGKRRVLFISVLAVMLVAVLCTGITVFASVGGSGKASITLDYKSITLEKNESVILQATVNGSSETVVWGTTDDSVISVNNGKVVALKEGNALVTAKVGDQTAKCQVKVNDNGLVLQTVNNIGSEELNIMKGDAFDLEYYATYNNKKVDAEVSVTVVDGSVASVVSNSLNGLEFGSTQLIFKAEWNGLTAIDVVTLNVVNNLIVDFKAAGTIELFNDERAGSTDYVLVPDVSENGVALDEDQYEIVGAEYDEAIVDFNSETMTVTGRQKGTTALSIILKSKLSQSTVKSVVNFTVGLYTEDKSASTTISDVYIDEGDYSVGLAEVFADKSADEVAKLSLLQADDVTDGVKSLMVANNAVKTSGFVANGIIGERLWRIQSELYSYIVKVNVSEYNKTEYLLGTYVAENSEYKLVFSKVNNKNKLEIYDTETSVLFTDGTFTVYDIDKHNGKIKINYNKNIDSTTEKYGVYMDRSPMRVSIPMHGTYVDFYSISEGHYNKFADVYSGTDWLLDIKFNADRTVEFDAGNKAKLNQTGSYVLTPATLDSGKVTMTFAKPILGMTTIECDYKFDGQKYFFAIAYSGKNYSFVQKGEQSYDFLTEAFAGGYSAKGVTEDGKTGGWSSFYIAPDGTMVFETYILGTTSSIGIYTLNGNEKSGTISIVIEKAYCGNTQFEGTYSYNEETGKYSFEMYVYGSGYTMITFTQG